MSIQRYGDGTEGPEGYDITFPEWDQGIYVLYDDHVAEVERMARIVRIEREYSNELNAKIKAISKILEEVQP